ncbi:hypothetical protein VSS37_21360 [Candidatus Thiothrix sp. Deng01]|uniref:Uncharacterized protein n=1 Tax=Candidatus Thiothrix phosphatis TaxID=3112415 RepID=A0ABU6D3F1_9GAMM|nr:hypothetical protein [Candidatus Thiothrix sp. Deng01]MEB4593540.1 hypothetical protein [Candidatus Thiothrix sp. Deng01]
MEKTQVDMIRECLGGKRKVFRYAPDSYALQLLKDYIGDGMGVGALRRSPYAKLLNKPIVMEALALAGNGQLETWHLEAVLAKYREHTPLNFILTLDEWGTDDKTDRHWKQTVRTGYELVLQLNFASDHQKHFKELINTEHIAPFSYHGHPVRQDGKLETLAWARIDLDFATNQALIEELQSDWVKNAADREQDWNYGAENMRQYREVLRPYAKVWDEAILTAVLCLIRRDLGIREVFYHSYDTGNRLKGIERYYHYGKPPRYLYTELPKKFCFAKTSEAPDFLKQVRYVHYLQRHGKAQWFKLPTQETSNGKKAAA